MDRGRLEAFSDGVLAIIITIMVLEMKMPETAEITELIKILPVFLSYVLSFMYVGTYWNNHHHLLKSIEKIDGKILLMNMNFLFWISLVPFGTAWMNKFPKGNIPVIVYGGILFITAVAYYVLRNYILKNVLSEAEKKKFLEMI